MQISEFRCNLYGYGSVRIPVVVSVNSYQTTKSAPSDSVPVPFPPSAKNDMKPPKDTITTAAGTNPPKLTTPKLTPPNDALYMIEELCEKLGCSDRYILNNVRTGGLKANKVGNRYIFLHSNVVAWIQTL